jgi:hypothetical protein
MKAIASVDCRLLCHYKEREKKVHRENQTKQDKADGLS